MKFTIIARGPKNRGHRFMISAKSLEGANRAGRKLCRKERLEFVDVFTGHMAALRMTYSAMDFERREMHDRNAERTAQTMRRSGEVFRPRLICSDNDPEYQE